MDEQKEATDGMMPGKNPITGKAQGQLKRGNTINVGRKPNLVRLSCVDDFDMARPKLARIARGDKCVRFSKLAWTGKMDAKGEKIYKEKLFTRYPTPQEMVAASDSLARIGLPTKTELTGADDTPLIPQFQGPDLKKLTDEELRTYETLLTKACGS